MGFNFCTTSTQNTVYCDTLFRMGIIVLAIYFHTRSQLVVTSSFTLQLAAHVCHEKNVVFFIQIILSQPSQFNLGRCSQVHLYGWATFNYNRQYVKIKYYICSKKCSKISECCMSICTSYRKYSALDRFFNRNTTKI